MQADVKDTITCFLLINGSTVIARYTSIVDGECHITDPCFLTIETRATGPRKGDTGIFPRFMPLNSYGKFNKGERFEEINPNAVIFSYAPASEICSHYDAVLNQLAAQSAGIVAPTDEEKGAILTSVKGRGRQ